MCVFVYVFSFSLNDALSGVTQSSRLVLKTYHLKFFSNLPQLGPGMAEGNMHWRVLWNQAWRDICDFYILLVRIGRRLNLRAKETEKCSSSLSTVGTWTSLTESKWLLGSLIKNLCCSPKNELPALFSMPELQPLLWFQFFKTGNSDSFGRIAWLLPVQEPCLSPLCCKLLSWFPNPALSYPGCHVSRPGGSLFWQFGVSQLHPQTDHSNSYCVGCRLPTCFYCRSY